MVCIRFTNPADEKRALGWLCGRFSFTTYQSGETIVPELAVAALAAEDLRFAVEGQATYEQRIPVLWLARQERERQKQKKRAQPRRKTNQKKQKAR